MSRQSYDIAVTFTPLGLSDDQVDRLMQADPDLIVAEVGGLATISSIVEGTDGTSAAKSFIDRIRHTVPEIEVVQLDPDLVSIPDIADRTDRTRESVRLLVEGKRGPGGFPTPEGIVGGGIRVWRWAVVQRWFAEHFTDHHDDPVGLLPDEARAVNHWLATADAGRPRSLAAS